MLIAAEKLNFENFNVVIRAYRKYFRKKLFKREICRIKSSTHWRKLRINIVNSSGEIKLWKFQSNHSRIPEVISKKLLQHDKYSIYSSIHWRKLRINIAYSSVEIKLWKFQWRHSRIPEVLSKKLFKPDWCRI